MRGPTKEVRVMTHVSEAKAEGCNYREVGTEYTSGDRSWNDAHAGGESGVPLQQGKRTASEPMRQSGFVFIQ